MPFVPFVACVPFVPFEPLILSWLRASVAFLDLLSALPGTSSPGLRYSSARAPESSDTTHVEEIARLEVDTQNLDGHNWPVFGPTNVGNTEA